MNSKEFKALLDKITDNKTGYVREDMLSNLTKEERYSMVGHLIRSRTPLLKWLINEEDMPWVHSCGYFYEKTNKAGFTFLCTSENMSSITSHEDEHKEIVKHAIESYGFLLWKQKEFTGNELAEVIKETCEMNARNTLIVNHLTKDGNVLFENPQYFAKKISAIG